MNWKLTEPWTLSITDDSSGGGRRRSFWHRRIALLERAHHVQKPAAILPMLLVAIAMLPAIQLTTREIVADEVKPTIEGEAIPSPPSRVALRASKTRQQGNRVVVVAGQWKTIKSPLDLHFGSDAKSDGIRVKTDRDGNISLFVEKVGTYTVNSAKGEVTVVAVVDATEVRTKIIHEGFSGVHVSPMVDGIALSGSVKNQKERKRCEKIAKERFANVLNEIGLGAPLHVECELIQLGVDEKDSAERLFEEAAGPKTNGLDGMYSFIVKGENARMRLKEQLKAVGNAETISAPRVITRSGRSASIQVGVEVPVLIRGKDSVSVDYGTFSHSIDLVPTSLGHGAFRLECRPSVMQLDEAASVSIDGKTIPGRRTRWFDTAVELTDKDYLVVVMKTSEPEDEKQRYSLTISHVEEAKLINQGYFIAAEPDSDIRR